MKQIVKVEPGGGCVSVLGLRIYNPDNVKPMYVRIGKRSITVSDRRPAPYGVKRA